MRDVLFRQQLQTKLDLDLLTESFGYDKAGLQKLGDEGFEFFDRGLEAIMDFEAFLKQSDENEDFDIGGRWLYKFLYDSNPRVFFDHLVTFMDGKLQIVREEFQNSALYLKNVPESLVDYQEELTEKMGILERCLLAASQKPLFGAVLKRFVEYLIHLHEHIWDFQGMYNDAIAKPEAARLGSTRTAETRPVTHVKRSPIKRRVPALPPVPLKKPRPAARASETFRVESTASGPEARQTVRPVPRLKRQGTLTILQADPQINRPTIQQTAEPAPPVPSPEAQQIIYIAPAGPTLATQQIPEPASIPEAQQIPPLSSPKTRRSPRSSSPKSRPAIQRSPRSSSPKSRPEIQRSPRSSSPKSRPEIQRSPRSSSPKSRQASQLSPRSSSPISGRKTQLSPIPSSPIPRQASQLSPPSVSGLAAQQISEPAPSVTNLEVQQIVHPVLPASRPSVSRQTAREILLPVPPASRPAGRPVPRPLPPASRAAARQVPLPAAARQVPVPAAARQVPVPASRVARPDPVVPKALPRRSKSPEKPTGSRITKPAMRPIPRSRKSPDTRPPWH